MNCSFTENLHFRVVLVYWGYLGGSEVKESAYQAGDLGSNPESGRSPGEGNVFPTPVFLPGKSHGQRSLASFSPWGCKESL